MTETRRTGRTGRTVLRELLLSVAAVAGVLCLLAAVASFAFHVRPLIFRSGSMGPAIETGALGLAQEVPATSLQVGDVVSVPNARGVRVTHRIHALDTRGRTGTLVLKGDANPGPDAEPYVVDQADRLFFHVNHVGYAIAWLGNRYVIFAGGIVVGVLATYAFRREATASGTRAERQGLPFSAALLTAVVAGGLGVLLVPQATGTLAAFTNAGTATSGSFTSRYWRCDSAILADGPRIYYKLNETGTTTAAADSSSANRPGTYQGTVTKGVASPCTRDGGTAVTLNGSTGFVSWNTASTAVPVTYSTTTWLRTTTTTGGFVAGWGASQTGASATVDRVIYMTNAGKLTFGINNAAKAVITSPLSYNDGAWHHVMATVGPAGMRLYVDGAQVATSATVANAYSGTFRVGYDSLTGWTGAPTINFLNGSVDEPAVYITTLTLADAQAQYAAAT